MRLRRWRAGVVAREEDRRVLPGEDVDRGGTYDAAVPGNVMVIVFDDAREDQMPYLPNVQAFRAAGTEFTQFRQNVPVCNGHRATFMLGVPGNGRRGHGQTYQSGPFVPNYDLGTQAVPVAVDAAGVAAAHIGKYFTAANRPLLDEGWSWVRATVGDRHSHAYDFDVWDGTRTERVAGVFQDHYFARCFLDMLGAVGDRPWFLWHCLNSPHVPLEPSEAASRQFLDVAKSYEANPHKASKPSWMRAHAEPGPAKLARMRQIYRGQLQELWEVDHFIGMLLGWWRGTGRTEDTTIVLTSDNANSMFDDDVPPNSKMAVYDWSAKAPLYVVGPGFEPGSTIDVLTSVVDLTATVYDVAGADPIVEPAGTSLRLVAADPAAYADRATLMATADHDQATGAPASDAVVAAVDGTLWKLARYHRPETGWVDETDRYELYDLTSDPDERRNLGADSTMAATIGRLQQRLNAELAR